MGTWPHRCAVEHHHSLQPVTEVKGEETRLSPVRSGEPLLTVSRRFGAGLSSDESGDTAVPFAPSSAVAPLPSAGRTGKSGPTQQVAYMCSYHVHHRSTRSVSVALRPKALLFSRLPPPSY